MVRFGGSGGDHRKSRRGGHSDDGAAKAQSLPPGAAAGTRKRHHHLYAAIAEESGDDDEDGDVGQHILAGQKTKSATAAGGGTAGAAAAAAGSRASATAAAPAAAAVAAAAPRVILSALVRVARSDIAEATAREREFRATAAAAVANVSTHYATSSSSSSSLTATAVATTAAAAAAATRSASGYDRAGEDDDDDDDDDEHEHEMQEEEGAVAVAPPPRPRRASISLTQFDGSMGAAAARARALARARAHARATSALDLSGLGMSMSLGGFGGSLGSGSPKRRLFRAAALELRDDGLAWRLGAAVDGVRATVGLPWRDVISARVVPTTPEPGRESEQRGFHLVIVALRPATATFEQMPEVSVELARRSAAAVAAAAAAGGASTATAPADARRDSGGAAGVGSGGTATQMEEELNRGGRRGRAMSLAAAAEEEESSALSESSFLSESSGIVDPSSSYDDPSDSDSPVVTPSTSEDEGLDQSDEARDGGGKEGRRGADGDHDGDDDDDDVLVAYDPAEEAAATAELRAATGDVARVLTQSEGVGLRSGMDSSGDGVDWERIRGDKERTAQALRRKQRGVMKTLANAAPPELKPVVLTFEFDAAAVTSDEARRQAAASFSATTGIAGRLNYGMRVLAVGKGASPSPSRSGSSASLSLSSSTGGGVPFGATAATTAATTDDGAEQQGQQQEGAAGGGGGGTMMGAGGLQKVMGASAAEIGRLLAEDDPLEAAMWAQAVLWRNACVSRYQAPRARQDADVGLEMPRELLCVVNPVAASGTAKAQLDSIMPYLRFTFDHVTVLVTKRANHARDIVAGLSLKELAKLEAILCCGGDGTVAEVLNGLAVHSRAAHDARAAGAARVGCAPPPLPVFSTSAAAAAAAECKTVATDDEASVSGASVSGGSPSPSLKASTSSTASTDGSGGGGSGTHLLDYEELPHLAILPAGSGNALARSTGLNSTLSALWAVAKGWRRPLDVMSATTGPGRSAPSPSTSSAGGHDDEKDEAAARDDGKKTKMKKKHGHADAAHADNDGEGGAAADSTSEVDLAAELLPQPEHVFALANVVWGIVSDASSAQDTISPRMRFALPAVIAARAVRATLQSRRYRGRVTLYQRPDDVPSDSSEWGRPGIDWRTCHPDLSRCAACRAAAVAAGAGALARTRSAAEGEAAVAAAATADAAYARAHGSPAAARPAAAAANSSGGDGERHGHSHGHRHAGHGHAGHGHSGRGGSSGGSNHRSGSKAQHHHHHLPKHHHRRHHERHQEPLPPHSRTHQPAEVEHRRKRGHHWHTEDGLVARQLDGAFSAFIGANNPVLSQGFVGSPYAHLGDGTLDVVWVAAAVDGAEKQQPAPQHEHPKPKHHHQHHHHHHPKHKGLHPSSAAATGAAGAKAPAGPLGRSKKPVSPAQFARIVSQMTAGDYVSDEHVFTARVVRFLLEPGDPVVSHGKGHIAVDGEPVPYRVTDVEILPNTFALACLPPLRPDAILRPLAAATAAAAAATSAQLQE